jgi:aryl-phospho-beta-D-glucosidase BglC (GH1 family)
MEIYMRGLRIVLVCALLVLIVALGALAYVLVNQFHQNQGPAVVTGSPSPTFIPTGMPHVQGTQIVDAQGRPFLLHGAQLESPFNNIKSWQQGKRPTQMFTSATFQSMAQQWHMNSLRLPISNWELTQFGTEYMNQLDTIVQEANQAGLYVILDLHDNPKAGSPYTNKDSTLPKTQDAAFWQTIAAHFKTNPMVMFDPYNEPQEPSWNTWLNGGGTTSDGATIVGFQDLVNAIRSTGAQQIIVLEPGSAGGGKSNQNATGAEEGGWSNFPLSDAIKDPNVVYSLHVYQGITQSAAQQAAKWGPVLGHYPLIYGEWAFLTNGEGKSGSAHCQNLPTNGAGATQVVQNFLNYAASIHASWIAWQFEPPYLVQNMTTYAPTTFPATLTCGDTKAVVGMGTVVQQWTVQHGNGY